MTPTERRAADMAAVATWLATLPSWGNEPVAVHIGADSARIALLDGTASAVAWLARVAATCQPSPAESYVTRPLGLPNDRFEALVHWRLRRPTDRAGAMVPVMVLGTVLIASPQAWTDALRAAAAPDGAAPMADAPEPAAPVAGPVGVAALFDDDEIGPQVAVTAAGRREALDTTGLHPAGRPLGQPAAPREAPRRCGNCAHRLEVRSSVNRCEAVPAERDGVTPARVRLSWPSCDLWRPAPPPVLDGQTALDGAAT